MTRLLENLLIQSRGHIARGAFAIWRRAWNPNWRYLFVLGHMRSGSTLLSHILMSSASVAGIGERNSTYLDDSDFPRLAMHAHFRRLLMVPRKFVLDQINHNRMTPDLRLLEREDVHLVFLIRDPGASIASMTDVLGKLYGTDAAAASDYYLDRLPYLARIADQVATPERAFFLTYDDLVMRTEATLGALTNFLDLPQPLKPDYRIFRFTGRRGDPSATIKSGSIAAPTARAPLDFAEELNSTLWRAYRETSETLLSRCTSVPR